MRVSNDKNILSLQPQRISPDSLSGDASGLAQHLLTTCADNLDIIVLTIEPDNTLSYVSGRGCRLLHLTPQDIGLSVSEITGASQEFLRRIEMAREGDRGPWRLTINNHVWNLYLSPVLLQDGGIRLQGVAENISQLHHLEQQRRWQEREMELLTTLTAEVNNNLSFEDILATLQRELNDQLHITGLLLYQWTQNGILELSQGWNIEDTLYKQLSALLEPWIEESHSRWQRINTVPSTPIAFTSHHFHPYPREIQQLISSDGTPCRVQPIPLSARDQLLGVLFLFSDDQTAFQREHPDFYDMLGRQIGIAWKNAEMYRDLQISHEQLRVLAQRIVAAQETERGRVARELHDELGQTLTCLKMSLDMAERSETDAERAAAYRRSAYESTTDLLAKVRQMSLALRPSLLDDLGLQPALAWYLERFTQQTAIAVHWTHDGIETRRFESEAETAAFRIIQESLTNVARHAQTEQVWVHIQADEGLTLTIEDAGNGFRMEDARLSSGLSGMRERALGLGGTWQLETAPGRGTRIEAHLPCMQR